MINELFLNTTANLISAFIILTSNNCRLWLFAKLSKRDPRRWNYIMFLPLMAWAAVNFGIYFLPQEYLPGSLKVTVPLFSSTVVFYFLWRDIACFWAVGIYGADKEINKGINYSESLKLCQTHLSFLGTGASKLTQEEELEKALGRFDNTVPVRFLLLMPTDQELTVAARRANKPEAQYSRLVLESLRKIANWKINRGFNIQVRFYNKPPIFRLMFIDESLCLASYNVFGKGDGSVFPQIHLVKKDGLEQEKSFYYPMRIYFEQMWEDGMPWDFKEFL